METLFDEILAQILGFVSPMEVIRSVSHVSKHFSELIQSDLFWRNHPLSPSSSLLLLSKNQLERYCSFVASQKLQEEIPAALKLGSLLPSASETLDIMHTSGGRRTTCAASSTDHASESIENALINPGDDDELTLENYINGRFGSWWSSNPSSSKEANEVLLFATRYPLVAISQVTIKPLQDPTFIAIIRGHSPVYTWKSMVIRAYRLPILSVDDDTSHSTAALAGVPCSFRATASSTTVTTSNAVPDDQTTIGRLLKGHAPVYESPTHVVRDENSNAAMTFVLTPAVVVANVVTITLIGKNQEQIAGQGYYACVEHVDCCGIPLV